MKSALLNILGSNAISQLLIIASTPLLTRLYDKHVFGVLGIATTLALLLSAMLSCRLEYSIHTDVDPLSIFQSCLSLIRLSMIVILLPGLLLISLWLGIHNALLIGIFAIAHVLHVCCGFYLNYLQKFRTIGIINLLVPLVFLAGALGQSYVFAPVNALLLWQAFGFVSGAIVSLTVLIKALGFVPLTSLKRTLWRHKDNIRYLLPSQLLTILALNLSVIGTAALFSEAMAGLVVIGQRIARAPVTVIGNGLNEVLRAAIPTPARLPRTFKVVFCITASCSVLMLIGVQLIPEHWYAIVLGSGWDGLKPVLVITVIAACLQLIGTSVTSMLTAYRKGAELIINILLTVAGILALLTTMAFNANVIQYLWLHSILVACVYSAGFVLSYRVMREQSPQ